MAKVYSAKSTLVTVDEITLSGFADNSQVKVDYSVDQTELERGLDGEACFIVISDDSGTIEITLKGYSQSNKFLMAKALARLPVHVAVRDLNGGPDAFIAKGLGMPVRPAPRDFGKGPGDSVWKFIIDHLSESGGGTASV